MREGWEYKKLGNCFPYIKNGANIKQIKDADGFPITRIETLSGGVFNRDRMGYAGIHDLNAYKDYVLEDGDLLMSHINSKTYIGRTVEYKKEGNETIIHGMNLLRLKCSNSLIMSSFMAYYTLCAEFKANVAKIRKDAVNQSSMAIGDLKKFLIPVPHLSIQQSIVAELDEINNLLSLKRKELETYDKLAQSIFYEMFGDPVENEKGWEVKKLGEITSTTSGGTPTSNHCEYYDGGTIPWLRSGEVSQGMITKTEMFITEAGLANSSAKYVPVDSVAIAMYGATVGQVGIIKKQMTTNQAICSIFPSDFLVPIYLMFFLRNMKPHYLKLAIGGAQPNISQSIIKATKIPLPPLPLQQLFATRIEAIEEQKANVKTAIEKLETLLAARMQYWFD